MKFARHRIIFCLLALLALLAACAQTSGPQPEALLQEYERGGYSPHAKLDTTSARDMWTDPDGWEKLEVKLVGPAVAGRYPVVLYLPGLGETVDDGAAWCNAWAASGYVVVVVQPQRDGALVWHSPEARLAEFGALARAHFSPDAIHRRVSDSEFALAEAQSRAARGDAILRNADFDRTAVAGFDLGAQTSLALAAGAPARRATGLPAPRAVLALSPYALPEYPSAGRDGSRIGLPVLAITGTLDLDPYGLLPAAALRQSVFQALPAGDKYLVVLVGGSHDTLAGDIPAAAPASKSSVRRRSQGGDTGNGNAGQRGGGAGDAARGAGAGNAPKRQDTAGIRVTELRTQMHHMALVESVTTAFLDMTLKDDAAARRWLAQDARAYFGALARLQSK